MSIMFEQVEIRGKYYKATGDHSPKKMFNDTLVHMPMLELQC